LVELTVFLSRLFCTLCNFFTNLLPKTDVHDEQGTEPDRWDADAADPDRCLADIPDARPVPGPRKAKTLERDSGLYASPPYEHQLTSSLPAKVQPLASPPSASEASPAARVKSRQGRKFARQVNRVIHARSMIIMSDNELTDTDAVSAREERGQVFK